MNNRQELDLLVDLAKLIKKHGPEPFEMLADYVRSANFTSQLAEILSASANVARMAKGEKSEKTKPERANSINNILNNLERTEPNKYRIISDFYNALENKKVLPTMRDINAFVMDVGLQEIRGNSRQKAIIPLIKQLIVLTIEELDAKLRIPRRIEKGDRSLEGWTDIILDRGHKQ